MLARIHVIERAVSETLWIHHHHHYSSLKSNSSYFIFHLIAHGIIRKIKTPLPSSPDREESPPPPQEHASGDSIVGLQPIVSGLEWQNTRSAAAYLHRISKDYQDKELNPPLPAVLVTASDSRTPVDYVYLFIDPAASALHRPDWLEDLRRILCEAQGFGPERRSAMDRSGVFPGGFRGPAGVFPAATEPVLGPSLCRHPGTPHQQGLEASGV